MVILGIEPSPPPHRKPDVKKENFRKQYVEVDKYGHLHGKITTYLIEDIKAFAKRLNLWFGWANQPLDEKQHFFELFYLGNVVVASLFYQVKTLYGNVSIHVPADMKVSKLTIVFTPA